MDRSFVEAIREGREVEIKIIRGMEFATKQMYKLPVPTPEKLSVYSLSAISDYCKTELDGDQKYIIHIENEQSVSLYSRLDHTHRQREHLVKASCPYHPFAFERKMDHEIFIISLQSQFCENDTSRQIISLLSTIVEDAAVQTDDDGVKQKVTVRKGVSMRQDQTIPNPVILAPYRTFAEVDQPEGPFVFRIFEGKKCALFEADGGVWKIQAVNNIRKFFDVELDGLVGNGQLSIIG